MSPDPEVPARIPDPEIPLFPPQPLPCQIGSDVYFEWTDARNTNIKTKLQVGGTVIRLYELGIPMQYLEVMLRGKILDCKEIED